VIDNINEKKYPTLEFQRSFFPINGRGMEKRPLVFMVFKYSLLAGGKRRSLAGSRSGFTRVLRLAWLAEKPAEK